MIRINSKLKEGSSNRSSLRKHSLSSSSSQSTIVENTGNYSRKITWRLLVTRIVVIKRKQMFFLVFLVVKTFNVKGQRKADFQIFFGSSQNQGDHEKNDHMSRCEQFLNKRGQDTIEHQKLYPHTNFRKNWWLRF